MKPDLYWIPGPWRGRLAIAARPRGGDWLDDEMLAWKRSGVDVLVSLLESQELSQLGLENEQRTAEQSGIRFTSFPIPDRGVPNSVGQASALIFSIARELESGSNVAIHCRQGIGRSGLIASGALMIAGATPDEATHAVSVARGLSVPETKEQRQWLDKLAARLPVPAR